MQYDPFDPDVPTDPYPVYAVAARRRAAAPLARDGHLRAVPSRRRRVGHRRRRPVQLRRHAGRAPRPAHRHRRGAAAPGRRHGRRSCRSTPPATASCAHIVNRGFTPRHITSWRRPHRGAGRRPARRCSGRATPLDVVGRLAAPLPVRVIAELLGGDAAQADQFKVWADSLTRMMNGSDRSGEASPEAAEAMLGLFSYITAAIEDRQHGPPRRPAHHPPPRPGRRRAQPRRGRRVRRVCSSSPAPRRPRT